MTERIVPKNSPSLRYAVDSLEREQWNELVSLFDDATIHQTWSWGELCWSNKQMSNLVVYEGEEIVAAAQVIIVSLPVIGAGIAHCKFGPMWRRTGQAERPDLYQYTLEAMTEAYSRQRNLLLRVKPWEADDDSARYARLRAAAGMHQRSGEDTYDTFVVDASRSLEDLRAGFASKWRYNLKKSEKRNLEVTAGNDRDAADVYMQLYSQMRQIKSYDDHSEVAILLSLMDDLPEQLRPTVFTAIHDGQPAASIVVSHIGRVGYYLFGATGKLGRDTGASYLLFWEALSWLHSRDCTWFDLVGSRPQTPNGRHGYRQFKAGVVGKANGAEVSMKDWEACSSLRSRIVVAGGGWIRGRLPTLNRSKADVTSTQ